MATLRSLLASLALLVACSPAAAEPTEAIGDGRDDAFLAGKADGACLDAGSAAATGVLAFVNDPATDVELLDREADDGGVGLTRRAAQNLVAARPIADLAALDAVPWIGPASCRALAEYACNEVERCVATLDVMTWNLEHFPKTAATEDAVVELLGALAPDLVGVQEVESTTALQHVVDALPGYARVLGKRADTRVALLYREAAFELRGVEQLFTDDGSAFPRPPLAVTMVPRGAVDPHEVVFVVVHLKALSGASNEARRRDAVTKLRAWIDQRRALTPDIVVLGDWNDRIEEGPDTNVFGPLLDAGARVEFLTAEAAQTGAYSYVPFRSLIDHIAVTEEALEDLRDPELEVLPLEQTWGGGDYVDEVTDHRPVRARFETAVGY